MAAPILTSMKILSAYWADKINIFISEYHIPDNRKKVLQYMTTLDKPDFNDQFWGLLSDYLWRSSVGYLHAGNSNKKEMAVNAL